MEINDKAKEIFYKMYNVDDPMGNYPMCFDTAKKCALIAVNEMLEWMTEVMKWNPDFNGNVIYWQEVKEAIEKYKK